MTAPTQPDVHAIPFGATKHKPDRLCRCAPRSMADLEVAGRVIYVHRRPVERKPSLRLEDEA